eukprot:TRINITY_DN6676_c0_g1_i1.p1 TRINITY_DN6676_c0_g1~~TRINITY_DN6676_c0_g1_i1.p1  ORF type:complete len:183 (-),score=48.16 TRINITY_DN6676_c0_g1_i1:86-634(-)
MKLISNKNSNNIFFKNTIKSTNFGFTSLHLNIKRNYFPKKKIVNYDKMQADPTKYANKYNQEQVFFPFIPIRVASYSEKTKMLVLHTPPCYGKVDIKYYLRQMYNIEIEKINSLNVDGKVKRPYQFPRGAPYRLKNYKKFYIRIAKDQPASTKAKELFPEDLLEEVNDEPKVEESVKIKEKI